MKAEKFSLLAYCSGKIKTLENGDIIVARRIGKNKTVVCTMHPNREVNSPGQVRGQMRFKKATAEMKRQLGDTETRTEWEEAYRRNHKRLNGTTYSTLRGFITACCYKSIVKSEQTIMNMKTEEIRLSEHFALSEFTRSETAERHHIDNSLDLATEHGKTVTSNLLCICQTILEPLRQHTGCPIIVSSGYRCAELNRLVGGAANSQHLTGEAVDFVLGRKTGNEGLKTEDSGLTEAFIWLQDHTRFDQLILETNGTTKWIHVSLRRHDVLNRQKVLVLKK